MSLLISYVKSVDGKLHCGSELCEVETDFLALNPNSIISSSHFLDKKAVEDWKIKRYAALHGSVVSAQAEQEKEPPTAKKGAFTNEVRPEKKRKKA